MEPDVLSFVNDTHTAATKFLDDSVVRDALADRRVRARHSVAILAPATPSGWWYDSETPVESSMTGE
jgi:hypothetical protein